MGPGKKRFSTHFGRIDEVNAFSSELASHLLLGLEPVSLILCLLFLKTSCLLTFCYQITFHFPFGTMDKSTPKRKKIPITCQNYWMHPLQKRVDNKH